jgi:hypothetical protein
LDKMNVTSIENQRAIVLFRGSGDSIRQIVKKVGVAKNTVTGNLRKRSPMEKKFTCLSLYKCLKCGRRVSFQKELTFAGRVVTFSCNCGWQCPEYINLKTNKIEGGEQKDCKPNAIVSANAEQVQSNIIEDEPMTRKASPDVKCTGCHRPDQTIQTQDGLCCRCVTRKAKGQPLIGSIPTGAAAHKPKEELPAGVELPPIKIKAKESALKERKEIPGKKSLTSLVTDPLEEQRLGIFLDFSDDKELFYMLHELSDDVAGDLICLADDLVNGRMCKRLCKEPGCKEFVWKNNQCKEHQE